MSEVKKTKQKPRGAAAMGPGPGRPKGSQNKVTKAVKDMVIEALERAGGAEYLTEQALSNPNAFMTLVGRVIPTELKHDGSVSIQVVTGVPDKEPINGSPSARGGNPESAKNE